MSLLSADCVSLNVLIVLLTSIRQITALTPPLLGTNDMNAKINFLPHKVCLRRRAFPLRRLTTAAFTSVKLHGVNSIVF